MNFHEVRFPAALSFGSSGGPERRTEIVTLSNGFEERNSPWAHSRRRFDAGLGMRSTDDLAAVIAFFEARHGQLHGFRWKDWTDYKSCWPSETPSALDQRLGLGDGEKDEFALRKQYASGAQSYFRPIVKPVPGSVTVADAGRIRDDVVVDHESGRVRFQTPPAKGAIVSAGYEFDVPVRFGTDRISASLSSFAAGEIPSIPILEIRL